MLHSSGFVDWMMSCLPVIGYMACGIGNIEIDAMMQQVVINLQRICQGRHAV